MSQQMPLKLPKSTLYRAEDYRVGTANAQAHGLITSWPHWPAGHVAVIGPTGSGKTHLAHMLADATGGHLCLAAGLQLDDLHEAQTALILDDLHQGVDEDTLFHALNRPQPVVMMSAEPLGALPVQLPDLRSRLQAAYVVALGLPDDDLMTALLHQAFRARHHRADAGLIGYMLPRIERGYAAVDDLVEEIVTASLQQNRPINRGLVREILEPNLQFDETSLSPDVLE